MLEDVQRLIQEKNEVAFCNLFKNEQCLNKIKDNPWEIIPCIIKQINQTTAKENPKFYKSLLEIFNFVTDKIEPDDVILLIITEIPDVNDDKTLLILLKSVSLALIKLLPTNKINYLTWPLNAIQVYLNELPLPDNLNLEQNEKLLMDADISVARTTSLYYELLSFYDSLVPIIIALNYEDHKILLLRHILQLLGRPLIYFDMDIQKNLKSKARLIAEDLVHKVSLLSSDTYSFVEENYENDHEDIKIKKISLSCFYYLHLAELIELEKSPKVYDPIYVFQNTLTFAVPLLLMEHQFVIEKGLKLASSLLKMVSGYTLPYQLLDSDVHCKFCNSIANVIIYNSMKTYRIQALEIFHDYLYKFDLRGRYLLIYNISRTIHDVSLTSYIVTQYKQMLVQQFDERDSIDYYFRGSKLLTLFYMFCYLPDGVETDLMKSADKVIASLNLLRYLVLRDKTNLTDIWGHVQFLQKSFLDPLKEALILSKAHYNLKLKEIADDHTHGDEVNSSKLSVTIEGKDLPQLTSSEKVKVINSSLTAFDVIDSLLSRLNECINYSTSVKP